MPIAGVIIFFVQLNKDRKIAVWALIWAMAGLAVALVVYAGISVILQPQPL